MAPVQVAQMVDKAAHSEMRIGLNTSAFGNVEVRTVVHANDVGLVIGSEKGDLRSLLANDLPSIVNSLQQHDLRLTQVNFQHGFAFSNNLSSGSDSQQQRFVPAPPGAQYRTVDVSNNESPESATAESSPRRHAGLSILA